MSRERFQHPVEAMPRRTEADLREKEGTALYDVPNKVHGERIFCMMIEIINNFQESQRNTKPIN